jgi:hypothetical protein
MLPSAAVSSQGRCSHDPRPCLRSPARGNACRRQSPAARRRPAAPHRHADTHRHTARNDSCTAAACSRACANGHVAPIATRLPATTHRGATATHRHVAIERRPNQRVPLLLVAPDDERRVTGEEADELLERDLGRAVRPLLADGEHARLDLLRSEGLRLRNVAQQLCCKLVRGQLSHHTNGSIGL